MAAAKKPDLEYLLAQARRISEHREAGAEKEIRRVYKSMLKDLKGFVAEAYEKYAKDDKLTYADLQAAGYSARFLDEIEQKVIKATPKAAKELRQLVNDTYKLAYDGMVDAVRQAGTEGLDEAFADSIAITPEQIKRAVENPVSGLTLKDTLEKHRKEIIYGIKQTVGVGLMNGDRYSTMAQRISEHVDGDYKKAIRIARTEAHRTREAGNHDAALEVDTALQKGTTGLRMVKRWRSMKDERVRPQRRKRGKRGGWSTKMGKGPNHIRMDGQVVLESEPFDLLDGYKTMMPGSSGVAGHDINCRCYASRKMMTDAEYFAATGKHFPKVEKPVQEIKGAIDFGYGDYSDEDYNKWWDDYEAHNKKIKLSAEELKIIDDYTEGSFIGLNDVCRYSEAEMLKKGYSAEEIARLRKKADVLQGALAKFDLDTDIVTHRFERNVSWLTGKGNDVADLESLIGHEYTAKGFTSSGMLPNRFRFTGGKKDAVHFEIVTPKGTDGAFLYMSKKGENEFLYNRNTRFVVLDGGERTIKEWELNMKTLQMEQVDVTERFLKVQVVLDDAAKEIAEDIIQKKVVEEVAEEVAEKLTVETFPAAFLKGAEKKNTQKFVDYVNGAEGANADTIKLYNRMGKLESIESEGIPFKISHGKNHQVASTVRISTGDLVEVKLTIPKLAGENLAGQINTTLHEKMHLIDMYCRTDKKKSEGWFSTSRKPLVDAFKKASKDMSDEVAGLFKQFGKEYTATREAVYDAYQKKRNDLRESYFPNGASLWSDIPKYRQYEKDAKKLEKWYEEELDYQCRNIMGGGVNALQDIYDALSAGTFRDNGTVKYGHGSKYYRNADNQVMETLANYGALSVARPDLVELLRADKPDLVAELEATVKEMLRKAGD